jgi:quinol monooxygenase YgiN
LKLETLNLGIPLFVKHNNTEVQMIVVAKLKAQEEKAANLEAELRDMVEKVASEDGTIAYTLHKSSNDPTLFMFYEKYEDAEALTHHSATPYFKALFAAIQPLLAAPPEIEMYEELAALNRP